MEEKLHWVSKSSLMKQHYAHSGINIMVLRRYAVTLFLIFLLYLFFLCLGVFFCWAETVWFILAGSLCFHGNFIIALEAVQTLLDAEELLMSKRNMYEMWKYVCSHMLLCTSVYNEIVMLPLQCFSKTIKMSQHMLCKMLKWLGVLWLH